MTTTFEKGIEMPDKPSQLDKFKEAARDLGTDDDPQRFKERLGKLVKQGQAGNQTRKA